MSKFNVGDKLRWVALSNGTFKTGQVYTVRNLKAGKYIQFEEFNVPGKEYYNHGDTGFELVQKASMNKPHKQINEIKAWAEGYTVQIYINKGYRNGGSFTGWEDDLEPKWHTWATYRIKPEPKPDVVGYIRAQMPTRKIGTDEAEAEGLTSWCSLGKAGTDNIMCIFDGETGKLKDAKVI